MKVLIGGFRGSTNSARIIIDKVTSKNILDKLYLVNSFETSKNQLEDLLQKQEYDLIIMFGQKPKVNSLYLECQACIKGNKLITNHKYDGLEKMLNGSGFTTKISYSAGNYLCNHIFYIGLKYIKDNNLNTKMIFIHIPSVNNIESIDSLAHVFSTYVDLFVECT
jgi:pyroglutamyl-peptidase